MNFWHKNVFTEWESGIKQRERIEKFVEEFTKTEKDNYNNIL